MIIGKHSAIIGFALFIVVILSILNLIALTFCEHTTLALLSILPPLITIGASVYVFIVLSKLSDKKTDTQNVDNKAQINPNTNNDSNKENSEGEENKVTTPKTAQKKKVTTNATKNATQKK